MSAQSVHKGKTLILVILQQQIIDYIGLFDLIDSYHAKFGQ